jgi:plasmid stabilization system protein ParE
MGEYRVIISDEAIEDLRLIYDYIHERSPQGAMTVLDEILLAINGLDTLPSRFKLVGESKAVGGSVHAFAVYSYLIYYSIEEIAKLVTVLMVRHGMRHQPRGFE